MSYTKNSPYMNKQEENQQQPNQQNYNLLSTKYKVGDTLKIVPSKLILTSVRVNNNPNMEEFRQEVLGKDYEVNNCELIPKNHMCDICLKNFKNLELHRQKKHPFAQDHKKILSKFIEEVSKLRGTVKKINDLHSILKIAHFDENDELYKYFIQEKAYFEQTVKNV